MNAFFKRTRDLIFVNQTSMFSSTLIIAAMMLVARVFGFIRYRVLTGIYTTEELDIFFASFRIPDILFEVLITGALTTSFIPFFIRYQDNREKLNNLISTIINTLMLILLAFIIVLAILMPYIIPIITPGFSDEKISQITFFSQILLLGQVPFLVVGNILTGIGQSKKTFIIPSIAPATYNLSIIIATLLLHEEYHLYAPIIGVIAGALLFLIVQLPILSFSNFDYKLIIVKSREIISFFKLAIPRILTNITAQIDATIDLSLATLLGSGSYTIFYFAQHLQLLPISLIGIALGQASMPYLTEIYKNNKVEELKKVIQNSLLSVFYLTVPIAAFMIVSRTPIVRLFYGGDKFDWDSTVLTARTLSFFALSIPIHSIYYFLVRCFYASFDSKTPFIISSVAIIVNSGLSALFIIYFQLPVWSLAISFSIGITANVSILFFFLVRRLGKFDWIILIIEGTKIIVAAFIPTIFIFYSQRLLDQLVFDTTRTINVLFLIITNAILYFLMYIFLSWVFTIREMYLISKMTLKMKYYQKKIVEIFSVVE